MLLLFVSAAINREGTHTYRETKDGTAQPQPRILSLASTFASYTDREFLRNVAVATLFWGKYGNRGAVPHCMVIRYVKPSHIHQEY